MRQSFCLYKLRSGDKYCTADLECKAVTATNANLYLTVDLVYYNLTIVPDHKNPGNGTKMLVVETIQGKQKLQPDQQLPGNATVISLLNSSFATTMDNNTFMAGAVYPDTVYLRTKSGALPAGSFNAVINNASNFSFKSKDNGTSCRFVASSPSSNVSQPAVFGEIICNGANNATDFSYINGVFKMYSSDYVGGNSTLCYDDTKLQVKLYANNLTTQGTREPQCLPRHPFILVFCLVQPQGKL